MDVSDGAVAACPGYLPRFMTIDPTCSREEEHIYDSERKSEITYLLVDPATRQR